MHQKRNVVTLQTKAYQIAKMRQLQQKRTILRKSQLTILILLKYLAKAVSAK